VAAKILMQGSIGRAAYGLFALLFPRVLFSAFRISEGEVDDQARYFNRLFGGRDLLVAGMTVAAARAGAVEPATRANLVCEFTDTVSLGGELRSRGKMDRYLWLGLGFNVVGYWTWLRALRAVRNGD
jgi:hypothetical protein